MTYTLGAKSKGVLLRVQPDLVRCVELAIGLTRQDFTVFEGLRSQAQQFENVAKGVSWTTASKHLCQQDGFAHAVDLVPVLGGAPRWEWSLVYPVAWAMACAARQLGLPLRWGGVWDRELSQVSQSEEDLREEVSAYCVRHAGPDKLDGPHFELL